jgi:hypothetical protein
MLLSWKRIGDNLVGSSPKFAVINARAYYTNGYIVFSWH